MKCKGKVQKGKCRVSAERQVQTGNPHRDLNTLGGYDHVRIQVAKQVRTVPVRGCDAEKVLVLRSVISETVLPPTPTPHPDTSENVEKQQKTMATTCKNCPKMTSNDPRGRSKRPPGTLRGDPKSMVAKNMIFDELWGAKGTPKGSQTDHFRCQKASKNTPRNC